MRSRTIFFGLSVFLFYFPLRVAENPSDGRQATISFGEKYEKNRTVKKGEIVPVYMTCSCGDDGQAGACEFNLDGNRYDLASGTTLTASVTTNAVGEFEFTGACRASDERGSRADYATLKVVDFEIKIIFDDDFDGRSRNKAGITEKGKIVVTAKDGSDIFPLEELKVSIGDNSLKLALVNTRLGTADFKATFEQGFAVIEAKVKGGVIETYEIEIIEPNGVMIEQEPGTEIFHMQGFASCGFEARAYLLPNDVSFKKLNIKEGSAKAAISGYFFYQTDNGDVHPETNWLEFGSAVPGKGTKDGAFDIIHAGSDNHTPYIDGKFTWEIPWLFKGEGGKEVKFATVSHVKEIDSTGRVTISKGGASVSAGLNDPTTDY